MSSESPERSVIQPVLRTLRRHLPALLAVLVFSIFAWSPLLTPAYFFGAHDAPHSVFFLVEFDQTLRDGYLWPRWSPDFAFGYGYPLFNIYAPLAFYAAEILHLLGLSFVGAIKGMVILATIGGGLAMYGFLARLLGRPAGLLGGVVYMLAPFHLLELYVRCAYPEFVALALFPLILWAFTDLVARPSPRRLAWAGLSYGLLALTHHSSLFTFTPFLAGYVVFLLAVNWRRGKTPRVLLRPALAALGGALLGLGLAAIYLAPMLLELRYVKMEQWTAYNYDYRQHFVYFGQFLSPDWGYGYSGPGLLDGMSFQLGAVAAVLVVFGAWTVFGSRCAGVSGWLGISGSSGRPPWAPLRRQGTIEDRGLPKTELPIVDCRLSADVAGPQRLRTIRNSPPPCERVRGGLPRSAGWPAAAGPSVLFFLAATVWLVWLMSPAAGLLWQALPIASLVQFPWRLLGLATLSMSAVAGAVAYPLAHISSSPGTTGRSSTREGVRSGQSIPPELYVLCLIVAWGSYAYTLPQYTEVEAWRESPQAVVRWDRFSPADRVAMVTYTEQQPTSGPLEAQYLAGEPLQAATILSGDGALETLRRGGASAEVSVRAETPVTVQFYTYDYPGWQVTLDGERIPHRHEPPYGLITLDVPAGEHHVVLRMGSTTSRVAGGLMSLAAGLVILVMLSGRDIARLQGIRSLPFR